RALRLSPRDPLAAMFYAVAAYAAYIERDYAESIALCRKSIRLRNDFVAGWRVMVAAAGMTGDSGRCRSNGGIPPDVARRDAGQGRRAASGDPRRRTRAFPGRPAPRRAGVADRIGRAALKQESNAKTLRALCFCPRCA